MVLDNTLGGGPLPLLLALEGPSLGELALVGQVLVIKLLANMGREEILERNHIGLIYLTFLHRQNSVVAEGMAVCVSVHGVLGGVSGMKTQLVVIEPDVFLVSGNILWVGREGAHCVDIRGCIDTYVRMCVCLYVYSAFVSIDCIDCTESMHDNEIQMSYMRRR